MGWFADIVNAVESSIAEVAGEVEPLEITNARIVGVTTHDGALLVSVENLSVDREASFGHQYATLIVPNEEQPCAR